jgi:hypothetical protein
MRKSPWMTLIAAGALIGCGDSGGGGTKIGQSHGGIMVPLADNEAYVELLNGNPEKGVKDPGTPIVAYVLQPDMKTPLAEAPTSVEVKIGTPKGDQVVPLKAAPDSGDPAGSTRFLSEPGPFVLNQIGGEVTVQVGGKSLTGKFRGPR